MRKPRPSASPVRPRPWASIVFFVLVVISTCIGILYAFENWRGQRAWRKLKADLEAKGERLNWLDWLPQPVPDTENFFKAPHMERWFVREGTNFTTEGLPLLPSNWFTNIPPTWAELRALPQEAEAPEPSLSGLLRQYEQYAPAFTALAEAAQRPYARLPRDRDNPFGGPIVNFVAVRQFALHLTTRAKAHLFLGSPERADGDLQLLEFLIKLHEQDDPPFLVQAMISVALANLYSQVVQDGLTNHLWPEPQLARFQGKVKEMNLLKLVSDAIRAERAAVCYMLDQQSRAVLRAATTASSREPWWQSPDGIFVTLSPRGWFAQNLVYIVQREQEFVDSIDPAHLRVAPQRLDQAQAQFLESVSSLSPHRVLATIVVPNVARAIQRTAEAQTTLSQVFLACALERYRLKHGTYPESLTALTPEFAQDLPREIATGEALRYRRLDQGYLIYSVGWNARDDGGESARSRSDTNAPDDLAFRMP